MHEKLLLVGAARPPATKETWPPKFSPATGGNQTGGLEPRSPRGEKDKPALILARKWVTFVFSGIREMITLLPIVFNVEIRQSLDKLQMPGWYSP